MKLTRRQLRHIILQEMRLLSEGAEAEKQAQQAIEAAGMGKVLIAGDANIPEDDEAENATNVIVGKRDHWGGNTYKPGALGMRKEDGDPKELLAQLNSKQTLMKFELSAGSSWIIPVMP